MCSSVGSRGFRCRHGQAPLTPWLGSRLRHSLSEDVGPRSLFSAGARAAGSSAAAEQKLKLQSGEITREEKQPASAQSTPGSTPHSSPKQKSRGWFASGSSTALPGPNLSTMDSGSGDKDRNMADKWSFFGPRSLQKSDSGGFATQTYRGAQKPSPMDLIRAQATRMAEDPATFKPPKMDIPVIEGKKQPPRTHNLKPRDLNVLTPTGF
uniref:Putative monooxygenase p33MONOX n=1 Tax=Equus caballus TaxID=9796 RepID=A0A9L0T3W1_HORSE